MTTHEDLAADLAAVHELAERGGELARENREAIRESREALSEVRARIVKLETRLAGWMAGAVAVAELVRALIESGVLRG